MSNIYSIFTRPYKSFLSAYSVHSQRHIRYGFAFAHACYRTMWPIRKSSACERAPSVCFHLVHALLITSTNTNCHFFKLYTFDVMSLHYFDLQLHIASLCLFGSVIIFFEPAQLAFPYLSLLLPLFF